MSGNDYMVLVNCLTYNQSKYILDALNGFVMQKTNFPFVCLVMDDASTDGEQEVIKGFLDRECAMESAEFSEIEEANIVVVPHKTNPNCTMAVYFLKKNLYGTGKKTPLIAHWRECCKYEALCEGDDFWTAPNKLQKQYDALESNPKCAICFNRVKVVQKDGITPYFNIPRQNCSFGEGYVNLSDLAREEFLWQHWCFHTSSFFMKIDIAKSYIMFWKEIIPSFPYGDMPLQMYALSNGSGYFISEEMGCYRWLSGGWNSTMDSNDSLKVMMEKKVIRGFKEFDRYTHRMYHHQIKHHILIKKYHIIHHGHSIWYKFIIEDYPRHKRKLINILKFHLPKTYSLLKSIIKNAI